MPSSYDEAVAALYRAPHESFVAERQRLAAELKQGDDKAGAARLSKLARPSISAWAVNQLWWHAREPFDELFESAGQLRAGKLSARDAHRKALEKLTARARKLLSDGGHAGSEATVRRITMTLSGLAAAGGFDPDPPGALTKDRGPPGFEAFGIASGEPEPDSAKPAHAPHAARAAPAPTKTKPAHAPAPDDAKAKRDAAEAERRAREAEAKAKAKREAEEAEQRAAEERAARKAERQKLEAELREANRERAAREHERDQAAQALAAAERELERATAAAEAAETRLAKAKTS